jgi:hypothetical protein
MSAKSILMPSIYLRYSSRLAHRAPASLRRPHRGRRVLTTAAVARSETGTRRESDECNDKIGEEWPESIWYVVWRRDQI